MSILHVTKTHNLVPFYIQAVFSVILVLFDQAVSSLLVMKTGSLNEDSQSCCL
jgi:hypothetical protein